MSPSDESMLAPERVDADLFEQRIPKRPYATDELGPGLRRMSPKQALERQHIQINPPSVRFWLAFDIDRKDGAGAWYNADLPEPLWTAQNPKNGHAHSVWGIEAPVVMDEPDRQKPVRYLAAIESAYRAALDADPAYAGLLTKNPRHAHWRTFWGQRGIYGLHELAEYVDLQRHRPRRGVDVSEVGLGRNCTLFDHVRQFAYENLRHYRRDTRSFPSWWRAVEHEAISRNDGFPEPLPIMEVQHVAKSIAKWTWQRFDVEASDRKFKEKQARRGSRKGQKRREQMLPRVLEMRAQGISQQDIATALGLNKGTVSRWVNSRVAKP